MRCIQCVKHYACSVFKGKNEQNEYKTNHRGAAVSKSNRIACGRLGVRILAATEISLKKQVVTAPLQSAKTRVSVTVFRR